MSENAPSQQNSNPNGYDPAQSALQWMQQQLAEQGIAVSPEEALRLFKRKIIHDIRLGIQRDLAEDGIDVSPDEADAIDRRLFYYKHGTTDPYERT